MPIYEAHCRDCGDIFERYVPKYDFSLVICACGSTDLEQLISIVSFKFEVPKFRDMLKRGSGHNPFHDLTLQHVRDEKGKPIHVNSERELRAAEKKYNFVHAASWGLENSPPQHDKSAGDIRKGYKPKFNHDPSAMSGPVDMSVVGGGLSPNDTLAPLPNSKLRIGGKR